MAGDAPKAPYVINFKDELTQSQKQGMTDRPRRASRKLSVWSNFGTEDADGVRRKSRRSSKDVPVNIEDADGNVNEEQSAVYATLLQTLAAGPLGHFAGPDHAVLAAIEDSLSLIHFHKGDQLPASPFYVIRKGFVRVVELKSGDVLTTKKAGSFINWTEEYQGDSGGAQIDMRSSSRVGRRLRQASAAAGRRINSWFGDAVEDDPVESVFGWGRYLSSPA